jgi:hypothetical protein
LFSTYTHTNTVKVVTRDRNGDSRGHYLRPTPTTKGVPAIVKATSTLIKLSWQLKFHLIGIHLMFLKDPCKDQWEVLCSWPFSHEEHCHSRKVVYQSQKQI